eukprot:UN11030
MKKVLTCCELKKHWVMLYGFIKKYTERLWFQRGVVVSSSKDAAYLHKRIMNFTEP